MVLGCQARRLLGLDPEVARKRPGTVRTSNLRSFFATLVRTMVLLKEDSLEILLTHKSFENEMFANSTKTFPVPRI